MARLRGLISGNLKHATAARVYIAELAGDRFYIATSARWLARSLRSNLSF